MMRVLITGGSGLVGKKLTEKLIEKHFQVAWMSRNKLNNTNIPTYEWNIDEGQIDPSALEWADCIIHLAGASIAQKKWSSQRKKTLYDSRVKSARLIYDTLCNRSHNVKVVVSASAIGYYSEGKDTWLDEKAAPDDTFISSLCIDWEKEVTRLNELGIRSVNLRIGLVLAKEGGVYPQLTKTLPIRMLNYFGDGKQWQSWVHVSDLVDLLVYAIENPLCGVYNATTPNPIQQKAMMQAIAKASNKNVFLASVPVWILKLFLGELSSIVLASHRCSAQKILQAGFSFRYAHLEEALEELAH